MITARRAGLLATVLLLGSVVSAQEKPRLRGGFGRPVPTDTPTPAPPPPAPARVPAPPPPPPPPVPTPRPAAAATPVARPSPVPAGAPVASAPSPAPTPAPTLARPSSGEELRRATASVSVGYVLVPFVVTDLKGRARRNVRKGDVTLLVDGRPVAFDLFERSEDAPVSFTILLDGSGSMGLLGKMEGARAGISALLDARRPGDDFALYVFAKGEVQERVPFTQDASRVRRAVRDVVPFGKTALYDALARMPDRSLLGKNGLRAIVLLTDGIDNASALSLDELDEIFTGVDVPVYPLGIRASGAPVEPGPGRSAEKLMNVEVLGNLARVSGGRMSIVDDPEKLPAAVGEIERDLRSQYVIGFTPTGKGEVKFRRISLRISGPAYRLRVRAGYRGTEPPERVGR